MEKLLNKLEDLKLVKDSVAAGKDVLKSTVEDNRAELKALLETHTAVKKELEGHLKDEKKNFSEQRSALFREALKEFGEFVAVLVKIVKLGV